MKHCIIGSYPPPLGGVSVYIYRLCKSLKQAGNTVVIVDWLRMSNLKRVWAFLYLVFDKEFTEYNMNGFGYYFMVALAIRPFGKKIVFMDHNERQLEHQTKCKRIIYKWFLTKVDQFYIVGDHIKTYYNSYNINIDGKAITKHAFLPPPLDEENDILKTYDAQTLAFIDKKRPLIMANGFQVCFFKGEDLYGLDMCVEITCLLKKHFNTIGFLFALANDTVEKEYLTTLQNKIVEYGIQENFHFLSGQKEIWPLFKRADMLIRPTNTDGDAVSIREALYFQCPVLASDASPRAEGAVVFQNRNIEDAFAKALQVLSSNKPKH